MCSLTEIQPTTKNINSAYNIDIYALPTFTVTRLADTLSKALYIALKLYILAVCVFPGNLTSNLLQCYCNATIEST